MPNNIWSHISMDFIDSLPKSQGKTVIFVVVDMLRKYAHFTPLAHPYTATDVAHVFLDNIYKLHGLPNIIVSDRDKPHRQVTIRKGKQHKLSPKYYGPFQIVARVGQVAYKLQLPNSSQIHDVFHISQLKKCKGVVTQGGSLPTFDAQGVMRVEPLAILKRRMSKRGNVVVVYVLVQWINGTKEDATWEPIEEIQKNFPSFNI
ncbi:reverse transcriptase [Tanacetum coccineum]